MKKNYCLRVNDESIYFKSLEDVKKWFRTLPLEDDKLELEDGYYLDLESIEELIGGEEVEVYNNSMCERGDDYCTIRLEEFKFEFSWENEKQLLPLCKLKNQSYVSKRINPGVTKV